MTNERWLLVIIFATYLLHELWTLWPDSSVELRPFLFNREQVISRQFYIFLACKYAIWVIFMAVIYRLFDSARDVMLIFVLFQFAELIEFFLTYNKAMFHVNLVGYSVGINITNLKVVTMFPLVTAKVWQWNPGKSSL